MFSFIHSILIFFLLFTSFPRPLLADWKVTILAGGHVGYANGVGLKAQFLAPHSLSYHNKTLYVADAYNNCIRKVATPGNVNVIAGTTRTLAGLSCGGPVGKTPIGTLNLPEGIYHPSIFNATLVSDTFNNRILLRDSLGEWQLLCGGGKAGDAKGHVDGMGSNALFLQPSGFAPYFRESYNQTNAMFVADTKNHKIRILERNGSVVTFVGGGPSGKELGYANGFGTNALLNSPYGLAVDSATLILYIGDTNNHLVRAVSTDGLVTTIAGGGSTGQKYGAVEGIGTNALFYRPQVPAIFTDIFNVTRLVFANGGSHKVASIVISGPGIEFDTTYIAGGGPPPENNICLPGNGVGTNAYFTLPSAIAVDDEGHIFIGEEANSLACDTFNASIRMLTYISSTISRSPSSTLTPTSLPTPSQTPSTGSSMSMTPTMALESSTTTPSITPSVTPSLSSSGSDRGSGSGGASGSSSNVNENLTLVIFSSFAGVLGASMIGVLWMRSLKGRGIIFKTKGKQMPFSPSSFSSSTSSSVSKNPLTNTLAQVRRSTSATLSSNAGATPNLNAAATSTAAMDTNPTPASLVAQVIEDDVSVANTKLVLGSSSSPPPSLDISNKVILGGASTSGGESLDISNKVILGGASLLLARRTSSATAHRNDTDGNSADISNKFVLGGGQGVYQLLHLQHCPHLHSLLRI